MAKKKKRLAVLEKKTQEPDFWEDKEEAAKVSKEIVEIEQEVKNSEDIKKELEELEQLAGILKEKEQDLIEETEQRIDLLEKKVDQLSLKTYLGSKEDKEDALLQIFSGAGGRDAQDWAAMLLRMYERYGERKDFKIKVLNQSFGEPGGPDDRIGIKKATLEIEGKYAYGFLKKETGVHRLVRISPFSPQKLRHTSFAQVVVLPKFKKAEGVEIEEKDLKIETFRSSGPGGQYMQKTESAVRITHLPTGLTATCQLARSQAQNKKKALEILSAKLYHLQKQKEKEKIKKMTGEIDPAWGKQIRSYVLHPYKLVKDLRTGVETSNVEAVLDGEIDCFIDAEIKS